MAEKQLAYRSGGNGEFFADDDPLAELARIVGFDQRSPAPAASQQRQEPAFDLEDELLREFERYDAPRVMSAAQPTHVAAPAPFYPEPVNGNELPSAPSVAAEPHFGVEQSPVYEPAAEFSEAPKVAAASHWQPAEESWESVHEPATMPEQVDQEEAPAVAVPAGGARDLMDELEMSIGSEPPAPKVQQWAAATIRLPLANFNTTRRDPPAIASPAVEPVFDAPAPVAVPVLAPVADFEAPARLDHPAELDRHEFTPVEAPVAVAPEAPSFEPPSSGFDLMAAARDGVVPVDAALTEPAYTPAASAGLDIDDLLADVSRYPVPSREPSPARFDSSLAASLAAAPVAPAATAVPAVAKAYDAPVPDFLRANEQKPAEAVEPFDDHDFDLDLADIELELAELDLADTAEPIAAPPQTKPAPIDDWLKPGIAAAVSVAPAMAAPVTTPAPATRAAESVVAREPKPVFDAEPLPFDPTEISDTEERLESFEGIHVPALPPAEPEEPVAAAPDYDFDIDAEMASLFNSPVETAAEPAAAGGESPLGQGYAVAAPVHGVTMQPKQPEGLDEFERALEEDFRRSFRETTGRPDNVSQVMFESTHAANDRWRARSMRGTAIVAAAIVLVGGSAFGMYRWMGHSGSPLNFSSGEPRVITADKDPIKVVPADPGGKVVPNQDKAVYDRVAGAAAETPKQKELVTSDEQPVDVVQKTLIPENSLPDDIDGNPDTDTADANQGTPVGETQDPRLLPGQGNATAANGQDANPAVAPRRVRTMIVKPDGSLVARDDSPADDKAAQPAASPAKPVASGATQVAAADSGDAPSAESAPIRMVKTTQLANAPAAVPSATAPGTPSPAAGTAAASDSAPIPATRPATVPSTAPVVAKAPAAAKPAQVAMANPAPQPVKAAAEPAASAGGYVMQIASLPSEDEAKRSQATLTAKFANILGGHPVEIRKFDIAGKGTYYRVRVAAGSKDDAAALCVKFRAAGGTCLISK